MQVKEPTAAEAALGAVTAGEALGETAATQVREALALERVTLEEPTLDQRARSLDSVKSNQC